jgi:microcystin-dependent protein
LPTTTPGRALPVAALADLPDANVLASGLATALDAVASIYTGTLAARLAANSTAGTAQGNPGTFYWASDTKQLFLSLGGAWIDLSGASGAPIPIGGAVEYSGAGDPSDTRWLLEDGRAVSRTTYATLFATQSTTYGAGDGSTTFNLPDSRGRVTAGPDNMGTAAGAAGRLASNSGRGNVGGTETLALATANLPAHTHGPGTLGTDTDPGHSHNMVSSNQGGSAVTISSGLALASHGGVAINGAMLQRGGDGGFWAGIGVASGGAHNHAVTTGVTASTGSGTAFNKMGPYVVKNKIIRVL